MNDLAFEPQVLPDRAVIAVSGQGALAFLHNLLTVDLSVAKPAYGALLTPQGKILHDVFVVPDDDKVWLDVSARQAEDLRKRLIMYRLRAKLDIAVTAEKSVAVSSSPLSWGMNYADPRLADIGYRSIVETGLIAPGNTYNANRLALGLADSDSDIGSGEMFVHEANLDQLNAVSFSKGCYVGQEVVSRTHHRSVARKRILPVRLSQPLDGSREIMSGTQSMGQILSSSGLNALALIRLDRLAEATYPLLSGNTQVTVRKPAWAKFDVIIPEVAQWLP
jgi:folate-binding protein YgfZ